MDKQIEEMAIIINGSTEMDTMGYYRSAEKAKNLYNVGYRKIPENAVVLTEERYAVLSESESRKIEYCKKLERETRKETAEKFAERLKEKADMNMCLYGSRIVYVGEIDEICKKITEGKV